jgi:hypothetical protein
MNLPNFDWLMVFFVHEVSMYEDLLNNLFESIKRVGNGSNNAVWLVFDKLEESSEGTKAKRVIIVYKLEKKNEGDQEYHEFIEEKRDNDWSAAIRYVFSNVRALRKVFFTWSHGAAFGINTSDLIHNKLEGFIEGKITSNQFFEVRNTKWYLPQSEIGILEIDGHLKLGKDLNLAHDEYLVHQRDKEVNCEKLVVIWMSDLAKVLSEVTKENGKIDLMIMMNCNMMLFENGYMLRDSVDILIGSESKLWATGYDYKKLIQELNASPGKSNIDLAMMVVQDYKDMHHLLGYDEYLARTALFACKLSETRRIAELLNASTLNLLNQDDLVEKVKLIRTSYLYSVSGVETYFLVDLGLWLNTIFAHIISIERGHDILTEFMEIYTSSIVAKHIGKGFLSDDENGHKKYGHSGFSLFLPKDGWYIFTRRYAWCAYSDQVQSTFKNDLNWDDFILKLTSESPQSST